jgi:hypothetical protein
MNHETYENIEAYRYPWIRNLFFVVLYVALLIFLWHFPAPAVRAFMRNLLQGLLYLLAGLALVGISVLLFIEILPRLELQTGLVESLEDLPDGTLFEGRSFKIPALKNPKNHRRIWETLTDLKASSDQTWTAVVDEDTGVLTVVLYEDTDIQQVLRSVKEGLQQAGFRTQNLSA